MLNDGCKDPFVHIAYDFLLLFLSIIFNRQKIKNPFKKIGTKIGNKNVGEPLAFSQFICLFFVEFLTFDGWNCLGRTKNDIYRR